MASLMGFMSLIITLAIPTAVIVLVVSILKIKRNTEIQIEQNKRIIELLEKRGGKENQESV
ncbi:hypothetical protein [Neobacillus sp. YIM B06451]|uniref:hypothetical protein n=1 Tax=Neobacillus sp. YIM B06451 TaxID=3070994 RepID=UPI00293011E9|nr:hypothetical protein [Neobacillus sp. YIM B06451]